MKRLLVLVLTSCALLYSNALLASGNIDLPKTVTLATHDLYPYGSYQEDGSFTGVAYDRISCALGIIDVELKLNVRPWRRAQLEVQHEIADGFFAGSQNEKRDAYAVKSVEIADQKWQWFLPLESDWNTESLNFQMGAKVSSFIGANMQKYLVDNNYRTFSTPKDTRALAEMLLLGRIDAALANNYVMDDILSRKGVRDKFRTAVLKSKPLYVYFRKGFVQKHTPFLERFNQGVKECISREG